MQNKPWDFSPYIIGVAQFPDESGPEYFLQSPDGKIVGYFYEYDDAKNAAMRLKNESNNRR